jgi:hypothetical protein
LTLYLFSRGLEGTDACIVHTQHDEIIVEARDAIEDQVKVIVKESMEEALEWIISEVPFVAKIRVADAWGEDLNAENRLRIVSQSQFGPISHRQFYCNCRSPCLPP